MCAIVVAVRWFLSFSTETELLEIANKDTGRFRKLGLRRAKSTEENEKGEGQTSTEEGAIFSQTKLNKSIILWGWKPLYSCGSNYTK